MYIFHFIRQKHKTFRHEVWKWNVTDSGTSFTGTLALLNLLLTAQTLNYKNWFKWSARRVWDHVTNGRTSPKINTGSPALCLHQILRGPMNEISNLNVPVSSSLTRMHSKKAFSAFWWVLYCTKIFAPHHSLVTLYKRDTVISQWDLETINWSL